ncbi:DUF2098 domain-containing protein [Methanolobus sp.]|uniref:DUF2098 domain-containing protein n=1 Tax=Methanolobus sp. TaxID=1874737 RepID=UPI0025F56733|nr:DUF2098 domain-containing protein [Methanolobus sp.]
MEDSAKIETLGMDGNPIEIGSIVRYMNTGTVGMVLDLKTDDDGVWVLVDRTNLFYKPETLVIADASDLKEEIKSRTSVKDAESYIQTYGAEDEAGYDIGQVTGGG